jgi:hypothetical protein
MARRISLSVAAKRHRASGLSVVLHARGPADLPAPPACRLDRPRDTEHRGAQPCDAGTYRVAVSNIAV